MQAQVLVVVIMEVDLVQVVLVEEVHIFLGTLTATL